MPTNVISRPYRAADQAAMQALLRAFPSPFESYPSADELPELLGPLDPDVLLWDRDGELAGFAFVDKYNNLIHRFRPGDLTDAIEQELMAWAVERIRARRAGDDAITLDASAHSDDAAKLAFLRRHGFGLTDVQSLFMARSLTEPFPAPQLPPGFSLRPLAGEDEVAAYVAVHRAAYGTTHMTVEERLTIMHEPAYRPDLDLVAVAPAPRGALAAFCICFIDEAAFAAENARA
ncbi:MAG: hypothetical protein KKA73_29775, partial [Chloroflexi bacterium]|nr:hypothetical protein [Chloroflexota bacterium]